MDTPKSFLTVTELSKIIDIPCYTIRKLAQQGKLPAYRITRKYLFNYEEVVQEIKKFKV